MRRWRPPGVSFRRGRSIGGVPVRRTTPGSRPAAWSTGCRWRPSTARTTPTSPSTTACACLTSRSFTASARHARTAMTDAGGQQPAGPTHPVASRGAARQPIAPTSTATDHPAIVTARSSDVSGSRRRPPYGASMDPLDLPAIVDVCRSLKRGWDLRGVEQEAWGTDQDDLLTPVDPLASVTLRLGETSGIAEIWPTGYVRLMRGDSRVDHVQVSGPFELRDQLMRLTNWLTDHTP